MRRSKLFVLPRHLGAVYSTPTPIRTVQATISESSMEPCSWSELLIGKRYRSFSWFKLTSCHGLNAAQMGPYPHYIAFSGQTITSALNILSNRKVGWSPSSRSLLTSAMSTTVHRSSTTVKANQFQFGHVISKNTIVSWTSTNAYFNSMWGFPCPHISERNFFTDRDPPWLGPRQH